MASTHSLTRTLEIDRRIRDGEKPSVKALMRDFEVSRRAVLYDLAYLRDQLKAPLAYDRQSKGYYYTEPTWILPASPLHKENCWLSS